MASVTVTTTSGPQTSSDTCGCCSGADPCAGVPDCTDGVCVNSDGVGPNCKGTVEWLVTVSEPTNEGTAWTVISEPGDVGHYLEPNSPSLTLPWGCCPNSSVGGSFEGLIAPPPDGWSVVTAPCDGTAYADTLVGILHPGDCPESP